MNELEVNRSLYYQSKSDLLDIMTKLHLELGETSLTPAAVAHYKVGAARFRQAMSMSAKLHECRTGIVSFVPFVSHQAGNA